MAMGSMRVVDPPLSTNLGYDQAERGVFFLVSHLVKGLPGRHALKDAREQFPAKGGFLVMHRVERLPGRHAL